MRLERDNLVELGAEVVRGLDAAFEAEEASAGSVAALDRQIRDRLRVACEQASGSFVFDQVEDALPVQQLTRAARNAADLIRRVPGGAGVQPDDLILAVVSAENALEAWVRGLADGTNRR